jgi:excisionase family DNA binding protein
VSEPAVLTVKDAAALLCVSPATVRRWCRQGQLRSFQVGKGAAIRIPAAELRAVMSRPRA